MALSENSPARVTCVTSPGHRFDAEWYSMRTTSLPVESYRDLMAWQKVMELVTEIYGCTQTFPQSETYGLVSQLRRAAVSIPSNIAEGDARRSTG